MSVSKIVTFVPIDCGGLYIYFPEDYVKKYFGVENAKD